MLGTGAYLAPERIRGERVDGRADVYSLGCVLFECLTGEVPFPRSSEVAELYAHLEDEPPRVSDRRPGLPAELDAVVRRALAKDPDDRWQTGAELAEAARAALPSSTSYAPAPASARHTRTTAPGGCGRRRPDRRRRRRVRRPVGVREGRHAREPRREHGRPDRPGPGENHGAVLGRRRAGP
jgi:serine/threonine protein kinase